MEGRLILIVGPSGSGKSALLEYLHEVHPEIIFPVSCTTRTPRPGEVPGEKYYFLTKEEFETRQERGDFLEWASYGGNYYGTLRSQILPALEEGRSLVREVEVQGARQLISGMPQQVLRLIFIDAGSWENLEGRIRARAPIEDVELLARKKRYEDELTFKDSATRIIHNPDGGLETAKQEFVKTVEELLAR